MNPLVLHFLPSVIRGVYRFDAELSTLLPKLRTDATQQPVPEARQTTQGNRRAVLHLPVGLRQRGQYHVTLVHWRLTSAGP